MNRRSASSARRDKVQLGFLLMFGSAALIFFAASEEAPQDSSQLSSTSVSARTPEVERIVNKHLLETNHRLEMQRSRRMVENFKSAPQVGQRLVSPQGTQLMDGVAMHGDKNQEEASLRVGRDRAQVHYDSPAQRVQAELADQQRQAYAQAKAKEEYAQKFVENARRGGWNVILDENYVIVDVQKVGKEKPRLFAPQSTGSR